MLDRCSHTPCAGSSSGSSCVNANQSSKELLPSAGLGGAARSARWRTRQQNSTLLDVLVRRTGSVNSAPKMQVRTDERPGPVRL